MRFDIIITGTKSEALDRHVKHSLSHALDQHDQHVESLRVRLRDINGPHGGVDQHVRIIVGLHARRSVTIEETGEDAYATISAAAERVKQTVGRQLKKK